MKLGIGISLMIAVLTVSSCSIFTPAKRDAVVTGGVDLAICVLEHMDETPEQIVESCKGVALEEVRKVIFAAKKMQAKPPTSSSSAPGK